MSDQTREHFYREVAKENTQLDLAYAALLFAEHLTQSFDLTLYLSLLDEIADKLDSHILDSQQNSREKIKAFNHYFFEELKFTGNIKNYYHPHNSLLNKVLDARLGIPISLSAIYMEVGWRLGLPLWGVNLPGHFIVGCGSPDDALYIDVFGHGRFLSEDDCLAIVQGHAVNRKRIREKYLRPVPKKAILYRMLLNLKQIYVGTETWDNAYKVVDLMLAISPRRVNDIRDRGLLAYRLNRLRQSTMDIERYLFLAHNSPDADWLKEHLAKMEKALLRLN